MLERLQYCSPMTLLSVKKSLSFGRPPLCRCPHTQLTICHVTRLKRATHQFQCIFSEIVLNVLRSLGFRSALKVKVILWPFKFGFFYWLRFWEHGMVCLIHKSLYLYITYIRCYFQKEVNSFHWFYDRHDREQQKEQPGRHGEYALPLKCPTNVRVSHDTP